MGYERQTQPIALDRAGIRAFVAAAVDEELLTLDAATPPDPFGIDDPCPQSPAGHFPIRDCADVVCAHCSKVLWR